MGEKRRLLSEQRQAKNMLCHLKYGINYEQTGK